MEEAVKIQANLENKLLELLQEYQQEQAKKQVSTAFARIQEILDLENSEHEQNRVKIMECLTKVLTGININREAEKLGQILECSIEPSFFEQLIFEQLVDIDKIEDPQKRLFFRRKLILLKNANPHFLAPTKEENPIIDFKSYIVPESHTTVISLGDLPQKLWVDAKSLEVLTHMVGEENPSNELQQRRQEYLTNQFRELTESEVLPEEIKPKLIEFFRQALEYSFENISNDNSGIESLLED